MLVEFLVDRLVLHFVKVNTLYEVINSFVTVHVFVIGRVNFDFFDVGLDYFGIVA